METGAAARLHLLRVALENLWCWLIACAAMVRLPQHTSEAAPDRSAVSEPREVDVDVWYRRYAEAIHRRCLRLSRNEAQAMDLVQETFLRAHKYRSSYRGEAKPLSWLLTISDRCFLDTLRKKEPIDSDEVEAFVRDEEEGVDEVFARHELVARLLGRARRDVRQIVVLRYFDELDNHQIAARLEINERTVRRKLDRFLGSARTYARRP